MPSRCDDVSSLIAAELHSLHVPWNLPTRQESHIFEQGRPRHAFEKVFLSPQDSNTFPEPEPQNVDPYQLYTLLTPNRAQPQEDPRVAPLQDELKERMEDLRRFEQVTRSSKLEWCTCASIYRWRCSRQQRQDSTSGEIRWVVLHADFLFLGAQMLQRVQERTKEAEMGRNDAMQELDQLQIDNAKLVSQEREHMLAMDDLTDRSQASISQLERDKSHVENELGSERRSAEIHARFHSWPSCR